MSKRDVDVDALFERDADARLLARRREHELGLAPQPLPSTTTAPAFGAESLVDDAAAADATRPALIRLEVDARPSVPLIPGAVATIVVTVHDDGEADVRNVTLRVGLPHEVEALPETFARDELAIDGAALVGAGIALGGVPAGGNVRVRFSIRVLPGTEPIDIGVHADAGGVPVIAAPALRLQRRARHVAVTESRPFYELEEAERAGMPAEPEPPPAIRAVIDEPALPPAPPPPPALPVPQPPAPAPAPEVSPEPLAPEPEPEPAPAPSAAAAPVPSAAICIAPLTSSDARSLERIFAGAMPHGLAAFALLAGIACTRGAAAPLGLERFRGEVAVALPRALIAARMRKPTPPVVTPEGLAEIRADAPLDPVPEPEGTALVARFESREVDALRAVLARQLADPFLRGAQVLLAVAPRTLAGVTPEAAAPVTAALSAYRVAAGAWLMRVTVRRSVDRRYDPLTADDASLHAAGRALTAALAAALA